jgi:putative hydrolase of the HAD superfamily
MIYLKKKLDRFNIIIFDLDDTIYPQKNYDNPALMKVSGYLEKIVQINKNIIFNNLRKLKKIRRGNPPKLVFDDFLEDKDIKNKKKIITKCVSLFQNYNCIELKKSKSLKVMLKAIYKKKYLFLVTNGFLKRQNNKINNLGIKKYFKKVFILDGKKKKIKPSISDVSSLVKFINRNKKLNGVFVGDNKDTDRKFAQNLKIKFIFFQFPI